MSKENSPEFFYFDMGNVLLSFDYDIAAAKMSQVCGASKERCLEVSYQGELFLQMETGAISPEEFHARFSEATGTTSDCSELLRARCDMFSLMVPPARVATQVKGVRNRIGLLSNTSPDHFRFCHEKFGVIRELFDHYVLSYEVGVMKPDKKIFEVAIETTGVCAEKIFYVDDREENVAGAKVVGMDAVLYKDAPQLVADLRSRGVEFNL